MRRTRFRSRLDIYADLLSISSEGVGKTRLMSYAGITRQMLQECLTILLARELIDVDESKVYRTTEKGKRFLELYCSLSDALKNGLPDAQVDQDR